MKTTIVSPTRVTMLVLCLALPPALDANGDDCGNDTPCRYALSSVTDGLTPDPWQRFRDDLGADFANDDELVVRKPSSASTAHEAKVRSARSTAPSRERSGLLLFWLLQKGNPGGHR